MKIRYTRSILVIVVIILSLQGFIEKSNETVEIEVRPDTVVNENFYGFGVETLPWLWTEENKRAGVNKEDIRFNLERIKGMRLGLTRIFVPWETWNPSLDYKTFTWQSDEMKSLYKTLDLYEGLETKVILVTVDWSENPPWKDTEASASAVLGLLEHLIKDKGYSCIEFWTLTNEPELTYEWLNKMTFEDYVEVHRLVKKGLEEKDLSIKIIASDEVESPEWFEKTLKSLSGTADAFSSHAYLYPDEMEELSDFFTERVDAAGDAPFFLCEFGFRGSDFGVRHNSLMQDYEYGLLTANLAIEALNKGVSAASIWCLHQIRLIDEIDQEGGKMMRIGLWAYKDKDWQPFPIFYLYNLLTRFIRPDSMVLETRVTLSDELKCACVSYDGRYTLLIVNPTDITKEFLIKGIERETKVKKFIYSESKYALEPVESVLVKSGKYLKGEISPRSVILFTELD